MLHDFVRDDNGQMYLDMSDDALAVLAAQKQDSAFSELLNRFTDIMLYKVAGVRPCGMDADDLMQECSLALLDAVGSFLPDEGASFRTYACVCIDNRIRSAVRRAARNKHKPLSHYTEISELYDTPDALELADLEADPEVQILINESTAELRQHIVKLLSATEYKVFSLYLSGLSYDDIAVRLGIAPKSVDNALQRVRRKLRHAVSVD